MMMKSPIIHGGKKKQVVKALFAGHYDDLTLKFLNILISKNRESYLSDIVSAFIAQYRKIRHISRITVTTATQLDAKSLAALEQKLEESTITDTNIEIFTAVDPNLVGGFILEFDDKIYDASVKHKLELLKKEFGENLYISQIIAS